MADEWVRMSLQEWGELGTKLFGPNANDWKVVCPSCGLVQSRQDWLDLGMNGRLVDTLFAFSCIGRWKHPLEAVPAFEPPNGKGCRYLGQGTPNISPITVHWDGDERPTFAFATP